MEEAGPKDLFPLLTLGTVARLPYPGVFRTLPKTHNTEIAYVTGLSGTHYHYPRKPGSGFPSCLFVNCCLLKGHLKMDGEVEEPAPPNVLLRLPTGRRM